MTFSGALTAPFDLTSLSLDAALQLDRLAHKKTADLATIGAFGQRMSSSENLQGFARPFSFHENPVNIDILNSALYRSEGPTLVSISDLEARLNDLLSKINEVAAGRDEDESTLSSLKRFCLALHTALLEEVVPRTDPNDWMSVQQELRVA